MLAVKVICNLAERPGRYPNSMHAVFLQDFPEIWKLDFKKVLKTLRDDKGISIEERINYQKPAIAQKDSTFNEVA